MTIQDLVGTFSIVGSNQDATDNSYKGTLCLSLNEDKMIVAKWTINSTEYQYGTGFFKNNILVINFYYKGLENKTYKGVVVYKCIHRDVLEGFWSEKHGNPNFLGTENCFRVKNTKIILN